MNRWLNRWLNRVAVLRCLIRWTVLRSQNEWPPILLQRWLQGLLLWIHESVGLPWVLLCVGDELQPHGLLRLLRRLDLEAMVRRLGPPARPGVLLKRWL